MNIQKVVLHTQGRDGGIVLSEKLLNLNQHIPVEHYVQKMLKSMLRSSSVSEVTLQDRSFLKAYINAPLSFMEMSVDVANHWFPEFVEEGNRTLLFAMIDTDEEAILLILEMMNRDGFVSVTQGEQGFENMLVYNEAILPDTFVSVRRGVCVYLTSGKTLIKSSDRTRMAEFVQGEVILNSKDTYYVVDNLIHDVADSREADSTMHRLKGKRFVQDLLEYEEVVTPQSILQNVFETLDTDEEAQIEATLADEGVRKPMNLKDMKKVSLVQRHRIQTETGIEIVLPLAELAVEDMVEIKEEAGSTTIILKNVGKIL